MKAHLEILSHDTIITTTTTNHHNNNSSKHYVPGIVITNLILTSL